MATGGADTPLASTTDTNHRSEITEQSVTTSGKVYRSRVWEDLRNLFQDDHLTDVLLAAQGRSIPCHKVLLAAASKFFHDKFITNPETLEHNILDIDDIDFDTLVSIVSFIYSGNIELTVEKTEKLIPASVSLMLPELTNECKNVLEKMIITDTSICIAVYRIAKANSLEDTAEKVWQSMLDKFQEIAASAAFKEMSETEIEKYIKDEGLNVPNENPVFEAVVTWVKHDMENRKDQFEGLLDHITLSHCSLTFLSNVVTREPLIMSANCFQGVADALATQAKSQCLQSGTSRKSRIDKGSSEDENAKTVWKPMLEKMQEFTTTDTFKELSEIELREYITDKGLHVCNEDPVFKAVVTWVRHDMENRQDRFETLLECITLSHCSLDFLRDTVLQEPLMERGKCFQHVAEALCKQASSQILQRGISRQTQNRDALVSVFTDQLWVFIDGESKWLNSSLVTGTDMSQSTVCKTGDGILITGGGSYRKLDRQCWKLSLPTLACTAVPDLHVGRWAHATVCVGEQVYVLGGYHSGDLKSVEYLNEKTGSWSASTDMPEYLSHHTAVSYRQYIYVFGGDGRSKRVFVLNTVSKTWSEKANMPEWCDSVSSVVYRGRIYVLGGSYTSHSNTKYCMSYEPDWNQWHTHSKPKENHYANSAVVWQDRILLCGGHYTTVIEEYDPRNDTWTYWRHSLPQNQQRCLGVFAVQL